MIVEFLFSSFILPTERTLFLNHNELIFSQCVYLIDCLILTSFSNPVTSTVRTAKWPIPTNFKYHFVRFSKKYNTSVKKILKQQTKLISTKLKIPYISNSEKKIHLIFLFCNFERLKNRLSFHVYKVKNFADLSSQKRF